MSTASETLSIDAFNSYFNYSTTIILTIFGLLGNITVLFVYTRKKFRNIPMFRYYSISLVFETLELLLIWPYNFDEFFQFNKNSISCKIVQYLAYLFGVYISWIAVLIPIDRFISVRYPHQFRMKKTWLFQFSCLFVAFIILSFLYTPYFIFNVIIRDSNATFCGVKDKFTGIFMDISDFVISTLLPFIIMISLTFLTGYSLIHNKIRFNIRKHKKEKRLLKILISMDVFFFLCYFPWSAYVITNDVFMSQNISLDYMSIVYNITNFLIFFYCSCSFFIHFICNKKFRLYLLTCLKKNKVEHGILPVKENSSLKETKPRSRKCISRLLVNLRPINKVGQFSVELSDLKINHNGRENAISDQPVFSDIGNLNLVS